MAREADVKILRLSKTRLVWYGFDVRALLLELLIDVDPIFWVCILDEDLIRDGSCIVSLVILVLLLFRSGRVARSLLLRSGEGRVVCIASKTNCNCIVSKTNCICRHTTSRGTALPSSSDEEASLSVPPLSFRRRCCFLPRFAGRVTTGAAVAFFG